MAKRARAMKVGVVNAREMKQKLARFTDAAFAKKILAELAPHATQLRDEIRKAANAVGAPRDVADSVFSYNNVPASLSGRKSRYRTTAVVGVNRGISRGGRVGPSYFEWRTTSGPGTVDRKGGGPPVIRKRERGTVLGMSMASIYEYGSSNKAARPFFRPTVTRMRAQMRKGITEAMLKAIEGEAVT